MGLRVGCLAVLGGEEHRRNILRHDFRHILLEIAFEKELRSVIGAADFHQVAAPAVVLAADQAIGFAVAAFFGVALVYGFILENSGIVLGFFEEKGFHVYLGPLPAPLATTIGWCFILFCCVWTAERLAGADGQPGSTIVDEPASATPDVLSVYRHLRRVAREKGIV